jgi:hypothetical protein
MEVAFRTPQPLLKDGRVLITGGRGEMVTKSAELYDPKTRAFVQAGDTLLPFICDGHLVIFGHPNANLLTADDENTSKAACLRGSGVVTFCKNS